MAALNGEEGGAENNHHHLHLLHSYMQPGFLGEESS